MLQQAARAKVFGKLLASLQGAARGSRELDIIISYLLGDTTSEAGQMIQLLVEEGYPWNVISELLDEELPPYTRALDAALPGENIVLTLYSPRRSKWAASHRKPDGEQVLVWAATEPLARRCAALKGLSTHTAARPAPRPAAAPPRPKAEASAATRPAVEPAPRRQAEEEEMAESEWKILF
ncbi:MAG: hypothetical protein V3T80_10905 [Kiloniellales bacterium]